MLIVSIVFAFVVISKRRKMGKCYDDSTEYPKNKINENNKNNKNPNERVRTTTMNEEEEEEILKEITEANVSNNNNVLDADGDNNLITDEETGPKR